MTELLVLSALFMGAAIGFWRGSDHGKAKGFLGGYDRGFDFGYLLGRRNGVAEGREHKRDAKGRFTK